MKKYKHFLIGLISGWLSIFLFVIVWILFLPHSSYENDLNSQVILLNNGEKLLFTFDDGCVNTSEPDTPVLTYIKNDKTWENRVVPEETIGKNDEYILTTSIDKSMIFLLLPQKNNGYLWDLNDSGFQPVSDINGIEIGKKYIHERP